MSAPAAGVSGRHKWVRRAALALALGAGYWVLEPWVLVRAAVWEHALWPASGRTGPLEARLVSLNGRAVPAVVNYVREHGARGTMTSFLAPLLKRLGPRARLEVAAVVLSTENPLERFEMNKLLVRLWGDWSYADRLVLDGATWGEYRAREVSELFGSWAECRFGERSPHMIGEDDALSPDFVAWYADHTRPRGPFPPLPAAPQSAVDALRAD